MVCDCCGRKKKLFESFAAVKTEKGQLNFCVECNDIAYKIRDDANEHDKEKFDQHVKEWEKRAKKPSKLFTEWKKEFMKPLTAKFEEYQKLER